MNQIIRIGVIGLGGRGLYFARNYSQQAHRGFQLHSLCDLNDKVLNTARQNFGSAVRYFSDMNEMLHDPQLDAVIVATNDPHHVAPSVAALRAGKHALVEKPLCQTVADAQLLISEARRATGIFIVGFELREASVFRQMKALLCEGRIGTVKTGHCFDNVSVGGNYFFHDPRKQKSFYKSLLLQKATHSLDLLNWFMDSEPIRVYGIGGMDFYGGGIDYTGREVEPKRRCHNCPVAEGCAYYVDAKNFQMDYDAVVAVVDHCVWDRAMDLNDNSQLCISYANGSRATFHECHFTSDYSREFTLTGTRGKLYGYYDNPGRFLIRIEYSHAAHQKTEEWKPLSTGGGHGGGDNKLRDEFYRCIVANERPLDAISSAYYSTALAVCAEESIESGLPVDIPPLAP